MDIPAQGQREREFSLCLGVLFKCQLIRWGPPSLGRAICFPPSTCSNAHVVQKHLPRHMQRSRCPSSLGSWWPSQLDAYHYSSCSPSWQIEQLSATGRDQGCRPQRAQLLGPADSLAHVLRGGWGPLQTTCDLTQPAEGVGLIVTPKRLLLRKASVGSPWRLFSLPPSAFIPIVPGASPHMALSSGVGPSSITIFIF